MTPRKWFHKKVNQSSTHFIALQGFPMPKATYDPKTTIVLASGNPGKVCEFSVLLAPFSLTVLSLADFPELPEIAETGSTFLENSLLKSMGISQATGLIAVADDSGLIIDALNGDPGVRSARYSGSTGHSTDIDEQNTALVLKNLEGTPHEQRTGRFFCAMSASTPQGKIITAEGAWEGFIATAPQGENGFGYDPIFIDGASGVISATMSPEEKNARSHRSLAVGKLLKQWPAFWQEWLRQ